MTGKVGRPPKYSEGVSRIHIMIPKGLKDYLKERAERQHISITELLIYLIKEEAGKLEESYLKELRAYREKINELKEEIKQLKRRSRGSLYEYIEKNAGWLMPRYNSEMTRNSVVAQVAAKFKISEEEINKTIKEYIEEKKRLI